ncbi:integrase catalytic domain-containing protein [Trichonephila clavipes]|nr:integrase catalytic domain-containing protein [Trichonephila clavipes]
MAYCAVIYIRSKDATQTIVSRLLTSKKRVSPVKTQSLPRLELCSALLLANLLQATFSTLTVPISETFAWSDSKITLAWLKSEPRRWQPFVANRVAQIQELTPNVHWNFVSGLENPADCGMRGVPPTKLEKCNLWFNGPDCSPDDPCVLTPGHFLIGKALTATPQPTVPDDLRHCDRWRLLTRMTQHFWNRWSSEYLTLLQSISKWRIVQKNLDIGDLVLIKHDNSPPLQWKLGKVMETFPGKDGKVRVVKVKSQASELVRPIAKLVPLPINT